MIFDKNYHSANSDNTYIVYQEEQDNASFVNPYNDNPYMISSLQKLKKHIKCDRKRSVIDHCLADYSTDILDQPQINNVFETELPTSKTSLANYAKSSYQKVIKDLQHIQRLIDQLGINEVRL